MRHLFFYLSIFTCIFSYSILAKNSFSIAPTRVEIDLSKPKTESFVVFNNGDGPVRVEATIVYFPVNSKEMENAEHMNFYMILSKVL